MQARAQELAGRIAALEQEFFDLTSGQVDAIVSSSSEAPFLFSAARQALAESEQRFRAIFDGALDAMFLCDDERRYVDANSAACQFVGKRKAHILGKTMGEFLEISDLADWDARWQDMLTTGKQTGTCELRRVDGARVALEYSAVANIVPGSHLVVLRDVTIQQRAIRTRDELYTELERRNRGLFALNEIGIKLGESLDIHAVYETIFREFTNNFLESPHLAVALFDKERQLFMCDFAVVDGEVYDPAIFPPMPLGEGPTSRAFLDLEPKIVDIDELASTLPSERILHIGDEASPRSGLYVPLIINNEAIGVLSIQHYEADAFKAVDLTLLSVMAYHAAAAIANARLYSQTQQEIADRKQREYELAAIAALARDLRHVQSPAAVVDILLAQAEKSFSALGSAVVLNLESRVVGEVAGRGEYAPLHGTHLKADAQLLRTRLLHDSQVIASSPWQGTSGAIRSVLGVPLSVQNSQIGTIWLGLGRSTHVDDVGFLASLADIAASTIQRTRLYDQVRLQAQRLTRVMDTVVFGLLLLDRDHRIVIANQPARQDLEILAGVGVGEPLRALGGVPLPTILETPHSGVPGRELVIEGEGKDEIGANRE
ncbi:MAG: GAF domain-containing protein, partial [Litorilinea sp.]